jgi:hypothetical protein
MPPTKQLGNVLVNAPEAPDGLWIHPVIAKTMNSKKRTKYTSAFKTKLVLELLQNESTIVHSVLRCLNSPCSRLQVIILM